MAVPPLGMSGILAQLLMKILPGALANAVGIGIGQNALAKLVVTSTSGRYNIGIGGNTLAGLVSGESNVAIGADAMASATLSGGSNVAVGVDALNSNTSGAGTTAVGDHALSNNTTGFYNVAVGLNSGGGGGGGSVNTTGNNNTFIGKSAQPGSSTQRSYMTVIGSDATGDANNSVFIGRPTADTVRPAPIVTTASTTAIAGFNLPAGAAPSAPVDGDVWREDNTNTGLKIRINGVTKTITVG